MARKNVARNCRSRRFPDSAGLNILAGRHRGRCPQHRNELVMSSNFDAQDAKAAIRIVKGNALNQTG